jgi:hypothetical protein
MKIVIDIGAGKSCWNCEHLVRNLSVPGFRFGIPIAPTCLVFQKQIRIKKRVAVRLAECMEAELEIKKLKGRICAHERALKMAGRNITCWACEHIGKHVSCVTCDKDFSNWSFNQESFERREQ